MRPSAAVPQTLRLLRSRHLCQEPGHAELLRRQRQCELGSSVSSRSMGCSRPGAEQTPPRCSPRLLWANSFWRTTIKTGGASPRRWKACARTERPTREMLWSFDNAAQCAARFAVTMAPGSGFSPLRIWVTNRPWPCGRSWMLSSNSLLPRRRMRPDAAPDVASHRDCCVTEIIRPGKIDNLRCSSSGR